MIKTIKLESGREINLSDSAAFLLLYKNKFKKEPLQDLMGLVDATEKYPDPIELMSKFDMELFYNIAWTLAKITKNDPAIPNDPMEFFIEYPDFKPVEHVIEILDLALGSLSPDLRINVEEDEDEDVDDKDGENDTKN